MLMEVQPSDFLEGCFDGQVGDLVDRVLPLRYFRHEDLIVCCNNVGG